MKIHNEIIKLRIIHKLEFINITDKVKEILEKSNIKDGFVNIFSKHTTLGIKINEYEPLLLQDLKRFLEKIVPQKDNYFHDIIYLRKDCPFDEPKNAEGHLKCLFLESSQCVPVKDYQMNLGKWQNIIVIETSGPREREIVIQVIGD